MLCDEFGSLNPFSGESAKEVESEALTACFVGAFL